MDCGGSTCSEMVGGEGNCRGTQGLWHSKRRLASTAAEPSTVLLNCKHFFLLTQRNLKLLCTNLKKGLTESFESFHSHVRLFQACLLSCHQFRGLRELGYGEVTNGIYLMLFARGCPLTQLYPAVNARFLSSSWWEESWCLPCFFLDLNNLLLGTPLLIFFPKAFPSGFPWPKQDAFKIWIESLHYR